jgi:amidohydrolase
LLQNIHHAIDELYPEMIEIRRYLHQHPELSFKEEKTATYIANFYDELGLPLEKNIGGNGVIATLIGGKPGKTVALRADFDALPIQDQKNVPYKSKNPGVMHACGHDGHTATLLILAKVLKHHQSNLPGTVVFVHQHAEETPPGGARPIVESGALDHVDAIFGNHLWATSELGHIETRPDVFMAGTDRFEITVKGHGGHGAYPHETKDAIVIAAEIVTKLQTIISRRMDPLKTAVITVGQINAGNSFNVIAGQATIIGTVRYLEKDVQQLVKTEMKRMVHGICQTNDAGCDYHYIEGYPPLVNHGEETNMIFNAGKQVCEVKETTIVAPQMGGEDFAYYLEAKPGAFFFTGAKKLGNESPYPHHHPMFDFDEKAMPIAAKMLFGAYLEYQKSES